MKCVNDRICSTAVLITLIYFLLAMPSFVRASDPVTASYILNIFDLESLPPAEFQKSELLRTFKITVVTEGDTTTYTIENRMPEFSDFYPNYPETTPPLRTYVHNVKQPSQHGQRCAAGFSNIPPLHEPKRSGFSKKIIKIKKNKDKYTITLEGFNAYTGAKKINVSMKLRPDEFIRSLLSFELSYSRYGQFSDVSEAQQRHDYLTDAMQIFEHINSSTRDWRTELRDIVIGLNCNYQVNMIFHKNSSGSMVYIGSHAQLLADGASAHSPPNLFFQLVPEHQVGSMVTSFGGVLLNSHTQEPQPPAETVDELQNTPSGAAVAVATNDNARHRDATTVDDEWEQPLDQEEESNEGSTRDSISISDMPSGRESQNSVTTEPISQSAPVQSNAAHMAQTGTRSSTPNPTGTVNQVINPPRPPKPSPLAQPPKAGLGCGDEAPILYRRMPKPPLPPKGTNPQSPEEKETVQRVRLLSGGNRRIVTVFGETLEGVVAGNADATSEEELKAIQESLSGITGIGKDKSFNDQFNGGGSGFGFSSP